MLLKNKQVNAHLSQQKADELIGYLYLLIDELQQKYCKEALTTFIDNVDEDRSSRKSRTHSGRI